MNGQSNIVVNKWNDKWYPIVAANNIERDQKLKDEIKEGISDQPIG